MTSTTTSRYPRRGFTLTELIVAIVVLGLLAALAIPTQRAVINRTHDEVAKVELAAIAREAAAIAALDGQNTQLEVADIEDGTAGANVEAASQLVLAQSTDTANDEANRGRSVYVEFESDPVTEQKQRGHRDDLALLPVNVSSEAHGYVSYALNSSATRMMLAQRSRSGKCAVVWGTVGGAMIEDVYDVGEGQCVATVEDADEPASPPDGGGNGGSDPSGSPEDPVSPQPDPDGGSPVIVVDPDNPNPDPESDPDPDFPDPDISVFPPVPETEPNPALWAVKWLTKDSGGNAYLAVSDVDAGVLYVVRHNTDGSINTVASSSAYGAVVDIERGEAPSSSGSMSSYSFNAMFVLTQDGRVLALEPLTLELKDTLVTGLSNPTAFDTYDPAIPQQGDRNYRSVVADAAGVRVFDNLSGAQVATLGSPGTGVESLSIMYSRDTGTTQDMDVVVTGDFGTATRTYHFEDDQVSSPSWQTRSSTAGTSLSISSFGDWATTATSALVEDPAAAQYSVTDTGTPRSGSYSHARDIAAGFLGSNQVMYVVDPQMGCLFAEFVGGGRENLWCGSAPPVASPTTAHEVATRAHLAGTSPTSAIEVNGTTYVLDDGDDTVRTTAGTLVASLPAAGWYDLHAESSTTALAAGSAGIYRVNLGSGGAARLTTTRAYTVTTLDSGAIWFTGGSYRYLYSMDAAGGSVTARYSSYFNAVTSIGDAVYMRYQSNLYRWTGTNSRQTIATGLPSHGYSQSDQGLTAIGSDYIYAASGNQLHRVEVATGTVTHAAGTTGAGFRDGAGLGAWMSTIHSLEPGGGDELVMVDAGNDRIREVTPAPGRPIIAPSDEVTWDVGRGSITLTEATPAPAEGVAVSSGVTYYLSDSDDTVRRASDDAVIATLPAAGWYDLTDAGDLLVAAGTAGIYLVDPADGATSRTTTTRAYSVTVRDAGDIWFIGGSYRYLYSLSATGSNIARHSSYFNAVTSDGNTIYTRYQSNLYRWTGTNSRQTVASGLPSYGYSQADQGLIASAGYLYTTSAHQLHRVDISSGQVIRVAGNESAGRRDGVGRRGWFRNGTDLAVDAGGRLLLGDDDGIHQVLDAPGATLLDRDATISADVDIAQTSTLHDVGSTQVTAVARVASTTYYLDDADDTVRRASDEAIVATLPAAGWYDMASSGDLLVAAGTAGIYLVDPTDGATLRVTSTNAYSVTVRDAGDIWFIGGSYRYLYSITENGSLASRYSSYFNSVTSVGDTIYMRYQSNVYRWTGTNSRQTIATGLPSYGYSQTHQGMTVSDDYLYLGSGTQLHRVHRTTGATELVAGNPGGGYDEGTGRTAYFSSLSDITASANGDLMLVDAGNGRIRRAADSGGAILPPSSLVAHDVEVGQTSQMHQPAASVSGVTSSAGDLWYLTDDGQIRRAADDSILTTLPAGGWYDITNAGSSLVVAGTPGVYLVSTATAATSRLTSTNAYSVTVRASGDIWFVGGSYRYLYSITENGSLANRYSTYFNSVTSVGDTIYMRYQSNLYRWTGTNSRQTLTTQLPSYGYSQTHQGMIASSGYAYLASGSILSRVDLTTGEATTVAGAGAGYAEGTGINAFFSNMSSLTAGTDGALVVADHGNGRIRRVDDSGGALVSSTPPAGEVSGTTVQTISTPVAPTGVAEVGSGVYWLAADGVLRDSGHGVVLTLPAGGYYDLQPSGDSLLAAGSTGIYLVNPGDGSYARLTSNAAYTVTAGDGTIHHTGGSYRYLFRMNPNLTFSTRYSTYYNATAATSLGVYVRYQNGLYRVTGSNSRSTITTGLPSYGYSQTDQGIAVSTTTAYLGSGTVLTAAPLDGSTPVELRNDFTSISGISPTATGVWVADAGANELVRLD